MGRECMAPAECASSGMYITEEWFRKDLLRSMVMTDYDAKKVTVTRDTIDANCDPIVDDDGNVVTEEVEEDFALPLFDKYGKAVMVPVVDCND